VKDLITTFFQVPFWSFLEKGFRLRSINIITQLKSKLLDNNDESVKIRCPKRVKTAVFIAFSSFYFVFFKLTFDFDFRLIFLKVFNVLCF